jgi:hypothetical protein
MYVIHTDIPKSAQTLHMPTRTRSTDRTAWVHGYLEHYICMPISIHMHKHTCLPAQESISVSMCVHDARALFKAHTTHACLILHAYICSRARARLSALRSHAGMPNTCKHTHTHTHTPPHACSTHHAHAHTPAARTPLLTVSQAT